MQLDADGPDLEFVKADLEVTVSGPGQVSNGWDDQEHAAEWAIVVQGEV